jgi:hypothetical protein
MPALFLPSSRRSAPNTLAATFRDLISSASIDATSAREKAGSRWTAIARHLGELTEKKSVRDGGERFVGYQVPRP